MPESSAQACQELPDATAAFGSLTPDLLDAAKNLKRLQAPAIAPPAGIYSPGLIAHPVQVTNFRGIFNDHIAARIMAVCSLSPVGSRAISPSRAAMSGRPRRSTAG